MRGGVFQNVDIAGCQAQPLAVPRLTAKHTMIMMMFMIITSAAGRYDVRIVETFGLTTVVAFTECVDVPPTRPDQRLWDALSSHFAKPLNVTIAEDAPPVDH